MSDLAIQVENLGKEYRLGVINHHTLTRDLQSWWARVRGKEDPNAPIVADAARAGCDGERFWALKDLSFEVKQGEALGVIGRNGAGKSTLLKILSQVTAPTRGVVRLKGRLASLLEVGTGFHPELTGRENVFLNGAILGMGKAEIRRKLDEIIAFAEVDRFIDTPVKRYSSGMYVRLAFAVAAHLDPEILVVDEVLAVGDAQFQKKCLGKMAEVGREGRTVLFVSHNMSSIRSLCQRAMVIDAGELTFSGAAPQAIDFYLSGVQTETVSDFDLSTYKRDSHYGTQLRLLRLRLNGGHGLWHAQSLLVEIEFECLSDVTGVSFGLGFSNRDGVRIMTVDSDVSGQRLSFRKGQRGTGTFELAPFLLAPDSYTLDIGSRSGDNYGLDYLPQFNSIFVMPSDSTPSAIFLRQSIPGGYRPIPPWHFNVKAADIAQTYDTAAAP